MDNIASGNLRVEITVKTEDEVGLLGLSLQKVANILHKLLEDIHIMISEQERGNTDYVLNSEEFLGDYRILAESVLELADFGMKDQLTGIANRRSFDHRLEWEWNRAARGKDPISILMIDVDKFKSYNDSFGHQQGDVALKTVAQTVKQSIKRTTDFTARWGGEEFIVLLPAPNPDGAFNLAETIRQEIEKTQIPGNDLGARKVTVSIGASTRIPAPDNSIEILIAAADNALYKAQATGRNRVVLDGRDKEALIN
jgi:diguanylate cyclase (GGDEF)-like protein